MKWEYKLVSLPMASSLEQQEVLTELGKDEWEAVSCYVLNGPIVLLKRPTR